MGIERRRFWQILRVMRASALLWVGRNRKGCEERLQNLRNGAHKAENKVRC